MRKRKPIISITNEKQLDEIKKPLVSFYSSKKTAKSLLALDAVKEDIRELLREGYTFELYRDRNRFGFKVSDDKYKLYTIYNVKGKGFSMLEAGLNQMEYTHGDYSWMWVPPVILAISGAIVGSIIGHYTEVWAEETAGAIEKAELIGTLKGGGIGGLIGLIIDLGVGTVQAGKDFFEEPIRRRGLAKRVEEEYRNRK